MKISRCERPAIPGYYICKRESDPRPCFAEIREETVTTLKGHKTKRLVFLGGGSMFPLVKLEKEALFWGPVTLEVFKDEVCRPKLG